jgi:hypothetical protein
MALMLATLHPAKDRSGSIGAIKLRDRHSETCFDCGRRQGVARPPTVGHIIPATGAPQRPDATADEGGACTGPCVDGSGLASAFFTRAAVVVAAMCSAF